MTRTHRGPIDNGLWASQLTAKVVDFGAAPRLSGYDVQQDLASHYSFGELLFLCLTSELPERSTGKAFEVCLCFASPISVGAAPAHAAGLARLMGAEPCGVMSAAAIGLAERARAIVERHAELLAWLAAPHETFPMSARGLDDGQAQAVERFERALAPTGMALPIFEQGPSLEAALLGVLHQLGVRSPAQLEAALCMAAWPATVAEALAVKPFAFFGYPMNVPAFRYEQEPRDD